MEFQFGKWLGLCLVVCVNLAAGNISTGTYRAAVFEFRPEILNTLEDTIEANLQIYEEQIAVAAQKGVQIIAFPEYGLTTLSNFNMSRGISDTFAPYIEDPKTHPWNPCNEPEKYNNSKILKRISCAAKTNSIVVLINVLTRIPCNSSEEHRCREDNFFFHNSNVVFATDGSVLAVYHKSHLYGEDDLDPSLNENPVVFDAGFAKFGTFICFDIAYSHPSVQYVKELGIRNLLFSTAWIEELPFLTAQQFFNAWAIGAGVNFIAVNMFLPNKTRLGSGLFSAKSGALNYTYDLSKPNSLIIADLPLNPDEGSTSDLFHSFYNPNTETQLYANKEFTNLPSSEPTNQKLKIYHQNLTAFNYTMLDSDTGNISLCQRNVCCNLTYEYEPRDIMVARHALIVLDGPHVFYKYNWSAEICAVVRCETPEDIATCGNVPKNVASTNMFKNLRLQANVQADLMYPHILAPNLQLPARSHYSYRGLNTCSENSVSECRRSATLELEKPTSLLTFALYGKFYSDYKNLS